MNEYDKIMRYLKQEVTRLKKRRYEKGILPQESASLDGSILTVQKLANYIENKRRDFINKKDDKKSSGGFYE